MSYLSTARHALSTVKRSPASCRSRPSAICDRAELPVHRISTRSSSVPPSSISLRSYKLRANAVLQHRAAPVPETWVVNAGSVSWASGWSAARRTIKDFVHRSGIPIRFNAIHASTPQVTDMSPLHSHTQCEAVNGFRPAVLTVLPRQLANNCEFSSRSTCARNASKVPVRPRATRNRVIARPG